MIFTGSCQKWDGPTVSSGGSMDGGDRTVEVNVHNNLDGRETGRYIKKVTHNDIGVQI